MKTKIYHQHNNFFEENEHLNGDKYNKILIFCTCLIAGFMCVEIIAGWLTGSLALLSDAGHMLTDTMALIATLLAFKIGSRQATQYNTFGFKRFETLVAGINGATLITMALIITCKAIERFVKPNHIETTEMLIIAFLGLIVNLIVAKLLENSNYDINNQNSTTALIPKNLNMRSVYLHVLGDVFGSISVIIAALTIKFFNWLWIDAIASIIVAIIIFISGYRVLKQALHILMEGAPVTICQQEVEAAIRDFDAVKDIHNLHIWSLNNELHLMSCHIVVSGVMTINDTNELILNIRKKVKKHDIEYTTIQLESDTLTDKE